MIIPYYITELLFVFMSVFVYVKVSITTGPIWFFSTMMMLFTCPRKVFNYFGKGTYTIAKISFPVKKNLFTF